MKTIKKCYDYTEGYADVAPGITQGTDVVVTTEDGTVIFKTDSQSNRFNEVQVGGDISVRAESIAVTKPKLILSDTDYSKKALRRKFIVTENISLREKDEFIKMWHDLYSVEKSMTLTEYKSIVDRSTIPNIEKKVIMQQKSTKKLREKLEEWKAVSEKR